MYDWWSSLFLWACLPKLLTRFFCFKYSNFASPSLLQSVIFGCVWTVFWCFCTFILLKLLGSVPDENRYFSVCLLTALDAFTDFLLSMLLGLSLPALGFQRRPDCPWFRHLISLLSVHLLLAGLQKVLEYLKLYEGHSLRVLWCWNWTLFYQVDARRFPWSLWDEEKAPVSSFIKSMHSNLCIQEFPCKLWHLSSCTST